MLSIYYAHGMYLYDTPQEKRDVLLLESLGFEVLNPNTPEHIKACQDYHPSGPMPYFHDLVRRCQALAFRGTPDGSIPAGVSSEIRVVQRYGKPIIELPNSLFVRMMDVEETREYFRDIGQR